ARGVGREPVEPRAGNLVSRGSGRRKPRAAKPARAAEYDGPRRVHKPPVTHATAGTASARCWLDRARCYIITIIRAGRPAGPVFCELVHVAPSSCTRASSGGGAGLDPAAVGVAAARVHGRDHRLPVGRGPLGRVVKGAG